MTATTLQWQQFVWIAGLLLGWSGALIGVIWLLLRYLIKQFQDGIAKEHAELKAAIAASNANYQRLDADFKGLLVSLPIDYQRREDSIREYTVLNAKMDRLYEVNVRNKG